MCKKQIEWCFEEIFLHWFLKNGKIVGRK